MNEQIFRKKSLDRVKSPEDLDDYIRVSNPGVWLILISVIVILIGACVWGVFGHVDSTVTTSIRAENGTVVCYIADEGISSVQTGMSVKFNDFEAVISEIGQRDEQGYTCVLESDEIVPDGIYEGRIVVNTISPLSFVLN